MTDAVHHGTITRKRFNASGVFEAWGVIVTLLILLIYPRMLGPISQWSSDGEPRPVDPHRCPRAAPDVPAARPLRRSIKAPRRRPGEPTTGATAQSLPRKERARFKAGWTEDD